MEKGKIHINFEGCVQLVSIVLVSVLPMFCREWERKTLGEQSEFFWLFLQAYIYYQTQTFHNFLYSYYFVPNAPISLASSLLIRILSHQITFLAEKLVRDIKISYLTSVKPS